MKLSLLAFATSITIAASILHADDWPRWLGADGNNRSDDAGFQPDLAKYKTAWQAAVGRGYSSVIVAQGKAFVLGHDEKAHETVFCFDAASGRELWKHRYAAELLPKMHGGGPNASVTIAGSGALTLSKDGQLFALSISDGRKLWEVRLPQAMKIEVPQWGFGGSPVVTGRAVLVSAGKVIALDIATGKALWLSKEDYSPAYATPVAFESGGKQFIAAMNGKGLSILATTDGSEVAHRRLKAQFDLLAPTPLILDQGRRIFISGNASSEMLSFDGKELGVIWQTKDLKNALNNSVIVNDTIYGIDGRQGTNCRLVALSATDGTARWVKESFGYGTAIGVRDALLALTENGELVSATLDPTAYHELGRMQILANTCWTTPTVANGRIYVRNDRGDMVCLGPR